MTRKQDLKALHDKVAAGTCDHGSFPQDWHGTPSYSGGCGVNAHKAYNGSLDAAKALHDAVLPGWGWETSHLLKAQVYHMKCYSPIFGAQSTSTARAWLLAILAALIAQEAAQAAEGVE